MTDQINAAPDVGDALPEHTVDRVDPEKMKTMALLLRDPNPIHWDVASVQDLGMGDKVVNQGPNNMAYLVGMLAAYAGGFDRVRNLKVRFLSNVFAGDRLVAGGRVVANRSDGVTECEVWLRRDGNEADTVMAGTATVLFAALSGSDRP